MLSQITIQNVFFVIYTTVTDLTLNQNVSPKTNSAEVNEKGNNNDYISSMKTIKRKKKEEDNESI